MKLLERLLTRYWGYLALVIAVAGWWLHTFGLAVVLVLSLAAFGYFLLLAPVYCGAKIRTGEACRKNSYGLLRGCSYRQHKWQRLRQTFTPAGGRAILATGKSVAGFMVTVGGAISFVGMIASGVALLLH